MARGMVSLEDKQRWMRERNSAPAATSAVSPPPFSLAAASYAERHFSVAEVALMWNLSQDAIRKLLQDEPGVLVFGDLGSRHKRKYTTLRIPESVLERVHRRLANVGRRS
jgi:hypothetical protein